MSDVIPIIIGTAGHVDHGKTSLVKALTSFETDRHPEEKKRGMSIDFAVAPFTLLDGRVCGLLDVPGHEDFIRNMVSGASSVDIVLLIIAADDGIMPQTIEHLKIAFHLGAKKIIPVITKIDLVEIDEAQTLALEVLDLVNSYSIESAEPQFVSNTKNEGIEGLRNLICKVVEEHSINLKETINTQNNLSFRMFVRTCFQSKGHGNIVTGIPTSGTIKIGSEIELFPKPLSDNSIGTLRHIQNYRSEKETTSSHISSALNIRGIDGESFIRGSVICTPNIFEPTKEIIVWFKNTSNLSIVKKRLYQFHLGTFKSSATTFPLLSNSIEEGEEGLLRLTLLNPSIISAGDRFILREAETIGGGVVLSFNGKLLKREFRNFQIEAAKVAYKEFINNEALGRVELLANSRHFINAKYLNQISSSNSKELSLSKFKPSDLIEVGSSFYFNMHTKALFLKRLEKIMQHYHTKNPVSSGMKISQLAKIFSLPELPESVLVKIISTEFKISNGNISLSSFTIDLSKKEQELLEKIQSLLEKEKVLAKGSLLSALSVEEKDIKKLLRILHTSKIIKVISTHIFLVSFIDELKLKLQSNQKLSKGFSLADFRNEFNLSRNLAVTILEMLDSEGFTRRSGDIRIIASKL